MKTAFVVYNDFYSAQVMDLLHAAGIDYYTRWSDVQGKGRGTEAHLGRGLSPGTNGVLMIAFDDERPLEALVSRITAWNAELKRPDDRVRLFQMPLERMV